MYQRKMSSDNKEEKIEENETVVRIEDDESHRNPVDVSREILSTEGSFVFKESDSGVSRFESSIGGNIYGLETSHSFRSSGKIRLVRRSNERLKGGRIVERHSIRRTVGRFEIG